MRARQPCGGCATRVRFNGRTARRAHNRGRASSLAGDCTRSTGYITAPPPAATPNPKHVPKNSTSIARKGAFRGDARFPWVRSVLSIGKCDEASISWSSAHAVMLLNVINSAVREGDRNARAMTGVAKKHGSSDRSLTCVYE